MMMDIRQMLRGMFRNLLLSALLFLPLFFLGIEVEMWLEGVAGGKYWVTEVGGAAVAYVVMILPILFASAVHSVALLLIPRRVSSGWRRIAALFLSALVPLTIILSKLPGVTYLVWFPWATAVATLAYGLTCATNVGRGPTAKEGKGVRQKAVM